MSDAPILRGAEVLAPMPSTQPAAPLPGGPRIRQTRRQSADRFGVLNTFVDESMADLCRGDVAVWLVLYRDTREGIARTSQADIGRRAGLSVRGVAKALRRLEQRGLVKTVYRGGLNRGASRYRVLPRPDT